MSACQSKQMGVEMTVSEIMVKMLESAGGNFHDINHLMKVYTYAKTIAECEQVTEKERKTVEIAAIVHDIACPLCREKYGNADGGLQEKESAPLVEEFLKGAGLSEEMLNRIVYIVSHHHTPQAADGIDFQILLEADYLVNADESGFSEANIRNTMEQMFQTDTGKKLLKSIYGL